MATQCKTSRTRRVGTALAHKGEPRRRSVLVEHLASHNLEVPFRATVSIPYVSAIQTKDGLFTGRADRAVGENLR